KKALLAAILLGGALLTAALLISFESPDLGRDVAERLRSASGIRLEFSRARFGLARGLVFEDARASAGSYDVQVSRLVLEHRPLALLRGGFETTGIELDDLRGGPVSIDALRLSLSRLDYDPRAITALHGVDAEGILRMSRVAVAAGELRDLAARLTAAGGRVRFDDLTFATAYGTLSGELALDFNSLPFRYRVSLPGSSLQVEGVGRGTLSLEASGFGTKPGGLRGRGVFELARGRLPDAQWVRDLDPSLAGAEHGPVKVPFEINEERVRIERVEMEAAGRVIEIEGSLGLDGSRDLRVSSPG
ncbi:MAG TPA: hypothetical protein VJ921_11540, partial [Vicinamibacteria bacterium]|nr:hypothetical protein [Vicinamibacteria bacterium]